MFRMIVCQTTLNELKYYTNNYLHDILIFITHITSPELTPHLYEYEIIPSKSKAAAKIKNSKFIIINFFLDLFIFLSYFRFKYLTYWFLF